MVTYIFFSGQIFFSIKFISFFFYFSDDEESEDNISKMKEVDNVQKKLLAAAGQDVDAYMKEMEEVRVFDRDFTSWS